MLVGTVTTSNGVIPIAVTVDNDDNSRGSEFKDAFDSLFANSSTIRNLAGGYIDDHPGAILQIRILTGKDDESKEGSFGDERFMFIAVAQTNWLHRSEVLISIPGSSGNYHEFTLAHIIGHEFAHLFTGLDDSPGLNALVNRIIFEADGSARRVDDYGAIASPATNECFLAGTTISMWDGTKKPIEQVQPGDIVTSYDKDGTLKPGRVKRTMTNRARQILDVHGLMVTPGHATLCGDGLFAGRHVPIIDILRSDGALVREDGSMIRAATGCPLGSLGDRMVTAIVGLDQPGRRVKIAQLGQIRLGTRFIMASGEDVSVLDLIAQGGGSVTSDGMITTSLSGPEMPFRWTLTPLLPKPEDYVLQRSATHLHDIYQANEWEVIRPQMPGPTYGEAGPTQSSHPAKRSAAPVNIPLSMQGHPSAPKLSRKYRRVAEAKARHAVH